MNDQFLSLMKLFSNLTIRSISRSVPDNSFSVFADADSCLIYLNNLNVGN